MMVHKIEMRNSQFKSNKHLFGWFCFYFYFISMVVYVSLTVRVLVVWCNAQFISVCKRAKCLEKF